MRTRFPASTSGAAEFTPPGPEPMTRTSTLSATLVLRRRAERALVDLEHGRQRQGRHQDEPVGTLARRECLTDERAQLGEGRWTLGIGRFAERPADLAEPLVREPDDGGARDLRMAREHVFDLGRVDVVAAADEHLALPSAQVEVS